MAGFDPKRTFARRLCALSAWAKKQRQWQAHNKEWDGERTPHDKSQISPCVTGTGWLIEKRVKVRR